jgi:MYXO-CTERM domain-containing protein
MDRSMELRGLRRNGLGTQAFAPERPIDLQPTYLAARGQSCDDTVCGVGEIHVDLGAPPATPLWLVVKSAATEDAFNHWELWPEYVFEGMEVPEWTSQAHISVVLPADDSCVDVELFGVEGRTLFEVRRCEPDRCAVLNGIGVSTCGGPPIAGIDIATLPADSCGTHADAGVVIDDAGAPVRTSVEAQHPKVERDGCSVSTPRTAGASRWPAAAIVAVGLLGRARRRLARTA